MKSYPIGFRNSEMFFNFSIRSIRIRKQIGPNQYTPGIKSGDEYIAGLDTVSPFLIMIRVYTQHLHVLTKTEKTVDSID